MMLGDMSESLVEANDGDSAAGRFVFRASSFHSSLGISSFVIRRARVFRHSSFRAGVAERSWLAEYVEAEVRRCQATGSSERTALAASGPWLPNGYE